MEKITITTSNRCGDNEAKIFILSDIHIGNAGFRRDAFEETLDTIATEMPTHIIINGDMIDAVTRQDSKRFDPQSIQEEFRDITLIDDLVMRQCDMFIDYLQPIKNMGIEIIMLEGNHETAIEKYYGFSPYNYISNRLDAIRGGQSAFIRVLFGKQHYDIYAQHGSGGSGTLAGSALNKIEKLAHPITCDLYTMGHVHKMNVSLLGEIGFDSIHKTWIGVSGCYLDSITEGNRQYFANKMTSMSHIGYLVYTVYSDKKKSKLNAVYL